MLFGSVRKCSAGRSLEVVDLGSRGSRGRSLVTLFLYVVYKIYKSQSRSKLTTPMNIIFFVLYF